MKYLSSALLLLLLVVSAFSQKPEPTPPPEDPETIKISTSLIQVDVTVTDKDGNIVTDLKPEDFEIYENGQKQSITNFSLISSGQAPVGVAAAPPLSREKTAVPIPPVRLRPEQVRRTYALVVDDLGLSAESVTVVRQSLRKFVNERMQEGDLVTILRTGSGIGTLQSFTSDRRQLIAAIDKIKWNGQGRSGISAYPPLLQQVSAVPEDEFGKQTDGAKSAPTSDSIADDFRNENFSIGTLGSLNYIVRGMRELPGRKSLILFSEGFLLNSAGGDENGLVRQNRVFESMRLLADLANRASVVIYTFDPRGLQAPLGLTAQDNTWDSSIKVGDFGPPSGAAGASDASALGDVLERRSSQLLESQSSLRYLAAETGGIAFNNQNNLGPGLQRAIADQSSYYLLGYQPDDETFDPKKNKFNKLEIKLTRPGLKVRYRSGFFAVTDEKIQSVKQTPQQKLLTALASPFSASEVGLSLYPVFQNDPANGDLIQALVYIDARDLSFAEANGGRKANFDLVAVTFGDNGLQVEKLSKNYTLAITEKVYRNMLANGFVYTLSVPVKKAGAYQFRVALRDTASDKTGSASQFIEVPDVKKRMALSNLVLDNFTAEEWQKVRLGASRDQSERSVLLDATLRKFRRGTVLRYDYVIYNPKQGRQIEAQLRLIRDGKIVYEEAPTPVKSEGQKDLQRLQAAGAVSLGKNLTPGSYVLQVIATDGADPKKFAAQFVEFEIVD
jgi:VWFA-related protein